MNRNGSFLELWLPSMIVMNLGNRIRSEIQLCLARWLKPLRGREESVAGWWQFSSSWFFSSATAKHWSTSIRNDKTFKLFQPSIRLRKEITVSLLPIAPAFIGVGCELTLMDLQITLQYLYGKLGFWRHSDIPLAQGSYSTEWSLCVIFKTLIWRCCKATKTKPSANA